MTENIHNLTELQTMARYNRWANKRLFDCVHTLPDEQYRRETGAFFGSIHGTLNHILVGDWAWTCRITRETSPVKALDQILHDRFEDLQSARTAMDQRLVSLVDRFSHGQNDDLDRQVRYRSLLGGPPHSTSVRHIFLTLFNHHTHHRGQVHCLLTQGGIKDPPPLDMIFMLRDPP